MALQTRPLLIKEDKGVAEPRVRSLAHLSKNSARLWLLKEMIAIVEDLLQMNARVRTVDGLLIPPRCLI